MVTRDRRQVLGVEARRAYESLLGEWVYHRLDYHGEDVGIDGQVEVFEGGEPTGLKFEVQLKGTDQEDLKKALKVESNPRHAAYYWSLDLPVLIVLLHAPTGQVYVRWFHSFDPYYGGFNRRRITLRLSPSDVWSTATKRRLLSELKALREFTSPEVEMPVTFAVCSEDDIVHGRPANQLAYQVKSYAEPLSHLIRIETAPSGGHVGPAVVFTESKTVVDVAGFAGVTFHHDEGYPADQVDSAFSSDVLLAIALSLLRIGQTAAATRVAAFCGGRAHYVSDLEVVTRLSGAFARTHEFSRAFELAESLYERGGERDWLAAHLLTVLALTHSKAMSDTDRSRYEDLLRRWVEDAETRGLVQESGVQRYNLGNFLRSQRRAAEALEQYALAAERDPAYLHRGYFRQERGGLYFELEQYEASVREYAAAIEAGEAGIVRGLYADALMFAGHYGKAASAFERYLREEVVDVEDEFILKAWVLPKVIHVIGSDQQHRRSDVAITLAGPARTGEPIDAVVGRVEEALRADALWGPAWFNLGVLRTMQGTSSEEAFLPFLMAALSQPGDAEAWSNAALTCLHADEGEALWPRVLCTARRLAGDNFVKEFEGAVGSQEDPYPKAEVLSQFYEVLSALPPEEERPKLRWLGQDATYEVTELE